MDNKICCILCMSAVMWLPPGIADIINQQNGGGGGGAGNIKEP